MFIFVGLFDYSKFLGSKFLLYGTIALLSPDYKCTAGPKSNFTDCFLLFGLLLPKKLSLPADIGILKRVLSYFKLLTLSILLKSETSSKLGRPPNELRLSSSTLKALIKPYNRFEFYRSA